LGTGGWFAGMHVLALLAAAVGVWLIAGPVPNTGWDLSSFFWPYMVLLTTGPGALAGAIEGRAWRRGRVPGAVALLLCALPGLGLPLFYVTSSTAYGPEPPVALTDLVAAEIFWFMYWAALGGAAAYVAHRRSWPS
jgi:hypothetical protein